MRPSSLVCLTLAVLMSSALLVAQTLPTPTTQMQRALDRRLPSIRFDGVAFAEVIEFYSDVSQQSLFVTWRAMEPAGITRETRITLHVTDRSFSEVLQLILNAASTEDCRLVYRVLGNLILIGPEPVIQGIADRAARHRQRIAEIHPPIDLKRKLPEVRFDGVALTEVFDFLRDVSDSRIVVDWQSLEAAGIDKDFPVSSKLRNVTFGDTLVIILQSISPEIDYRIEDSVIKITHIPKPTTRPATQPTSLPTRT